jgi:hypothetical protein
MEDGVGSARVCKGAMPSARVGGLLEEKYLMKVALAGS